MVQNLGAVYPRMFPASPDPLGAPDLASAHQTTDTASRPEILGIAPLMSGAWKTWENMSNTHTNGPMPSEF